MRVGGRGGNSYSAELSFRFKFPFISYSYYCQRSGSGVVDINKLDYQLRNHSVVNTTASALLYMHAFMVTCLEWWTVVAS